MHAVENKRVNESAVAVHTATLNHKIKWKDAKLIKPVRKPSHLNAWESMFITNNEEQLMNEDEPPIISCLHNLTKLRIQ